MMTKQELNNLIRGKAQTNIPSIVQEIVRLSAAIGGSSAIVWSKHAASDSAQTKNSVSASFNRSIELH
jgi:hypothetical protein